MHIRNIFSKMFGWHHRYILSNFAAVGFSKGNKEKEICRRKPTEVSEHVRTSKFLEA